MLLSLVVAVGLGGCGEADKKEPVTKEPAKVFRVGVSPDFSPFEFKDEQGKMVGFDVELMEALTKQMNRKLEFQDMAWDGLIPGVLAGNIDAVISAVSITPERAETVLFSEPYYQSGLIVLVKSDNESIKGIDDLKGKKIAVQIGTTGAIKAHTIPEAEVRDFNLSPDTVLELKNGGVDAVVNDLPVVQFYLKDQKDSALKMVGPVQEAENYGIVVAKKNKELADELNKALKELKNNGEYDRIYKKWFGDLPKK